MHQTVPPNSWTLHGPGRERGGLRIGGMASEGDGDGDGAGERHDGPCGGVAGGGRSGHLLAGNGADEGELSADEAGAAQGTGQPTHRGGTTVVDVTRGGI